MENFSEGKEEIHSQRCKLGNFFANYFYKKFASRIVKAYRRSIFLSVHRFKYDMQLSLHTGKSILNAKIFAHWIPELWLARILLAHLPIDIQYLHISEKKTTQHNIRQTAKGCTIRNLCNKSIIARIRMIIHLDIRRNIYGNKLYFISLSLFLFFFYWNWFTLERDVSE